jgi:hypothetical protein
VRHPIVVSAVPSCQHRYIVRLPCTIGASARSVRQPTSRQATILIAAQIALAVAGTGTMPAGATALADQPQSELVPAAGGTPRSRMIQGSAGARPVAVQVDLEVQVRTDEWPLVPPVPAWSDTLAHDDAWSAHHAIRVITFSACRTSIPAAAPDCR